MPQSTSRSLAMSRRSLIGGLLSAGGLLAAGPVLARGVSGPHSHRVSFDIRREGASIGRHAVAFRRSGGHLEVEIEIDISVSLAFIPIFAYSHRNHEVWQGGRLLSLDSTTDDDGTKYSVTARALGDSLQVVGSEGEVRVAGDILPTSYWDARTVAQTRLLDTQRGRILEVTPRFLGEEFLDGSTVARRHRLSGDLDLDLWYSPGGEWLKIAFEARGAEVSYSRRGIAGSDKAPG